MILEATYGWYWAADVIQECGANVHLAHPLGNNWGHRRVKNDERDATDLVDLLRMGRLAEAWIAPPPLRANCANSSAIGASSSICAPTLSLKSTRFWRRRASRCP